MRKTYLVVLLAFVLGFAAHRMISNHAEWFAPAMAEKSKPTTLAEVLRANNRPVTYIAPEKILARTKKSFDEAVVVALVDETYDRDHKIARRTVVEIWKGPVRLVGKEMNVKVDWERPYEGLQGSRRALLFLPLTTFITTDLVMYFHGDKLGANPAITVDSLRQSLVQPPSGLAAN